MGRGAVPWHTGNRHLHGNRGFEMSGDRLACNRKMAAGAAGVVLLVLLAVAPAFACGGNRGTLSTRSARAEAGTTIDLNGSSFQSSADLLIKVRWGGPSGLLLAEVAPDESGSFSTRITVPAGAETGFHQISATQRQPDGSFFSATHAIEIQGIPAAAPPAPVVSQPADPVPTPVQATPAPAGPAAPAAPTAQPSTSPARTPAARATPVAAAPVAATPAAATPAPVPVAEPAPAVVPPAEPQPAPPVVESIPALPMRDPAVMGGPRTVTIDSGASLWMLIPLVGASLLLFAASCAAIVSDVRQRRVKAKVNA